VRHAEHEHKAQDAEGQGCVAALLAYGVGVLLPARSSGRRALFALAIVLGAWAFVEQVLGLYLRVVILGRAPVSNTYEAILWMGIVAMLVGAVAQLVARRGLYLVGGTAGALLCVLFAGLVPLQDQTNAIPAVLRSNYWLIVHVLTIVASYGIFLLAAFLGHVYLVRDVLLAKRGEPQPTLGNPLITQTYRAIQLGVVLLTAGTILGGIWAADSWGRFWGWDPKETWALISIIVYVIMLHARYVGWIRDFGLAVASVIGFVSIVWTFYGVNYVMAAGLHSYGMPGGEASGGPGVASMLEGFFTSNSGAAWVARWVALELLFVGVCKLRHLKLQEAARETSMETAGAAATSPDPA
jgi:cytochrome c-type biogenesis protein CcsB